MRSLVDRILPYLKSSPNPVILDIGCNDGTLLNIFKQNIDCTTVGIDPGVAISESQNPPDFALQEYFDDKSSDLIADKFPQIDLITFTNVFAHIEDLGALCQNLKKLISDSTIVIVENHYLGSVLGSHQFDTFYHEHPRTYSIKSFEFIAEMLDLSVVATEFPSRYGGNIRVLMSRRIGPTESINSVSLIEKRNAEFDFPERFDSLQQTFYDWRRETRLAILKLVSDFGPLIGKSLPARAVMLISALGLDVDIMNSVYERPTSPKVGNLVPGTNIPILSDELMPLNADQNIIVWSWHIISEIEPYLRKLGFRGSIWAPIPSLTRIS
jgi:SAM-dependent methyltransferase